MTREERQDRNDFSAWKDSFSAKEEAYDFNGSPNPKRYYRSRTSSVIAGVCGGLAERFGWEPTLVRLLAVALFLFVGGPLVLLAYVVVWIITPRTPLRSRPLSEEEDIFWRGVSNRPRTTFANLRYKFRDLDDRLQNIERSVTSEEWRLRKQFRDLERN